MQREWVVSRHGYRIACRNNWDGQNQVAIVCHGFGSSKNSPMVQALSLIHIWWKRARKRNIP